jgi:hypothetical protein
MEQSSALEIFSEEHNKVGIWNNKAIYAALLFWNSITILKVESSYLTTLYKE